MEASRVTKMRDSGEDRISYLPEGVLCHILSFLPTKYSVRTRILSTRWQYLFAYVPVLDFDSITPNYPDNNDGRTRFINFVNWVLMLYNVPQIIKFRLHCLSSFYEDHSFHRELDNIRSWISSAISRNVRELDISICYTSFETLPSELFSCKMLSTLRVEAGFQLRLPSYACLPCLKTLHLRKVVFDTSAKRLLSICPVLEELLLHDCDLQKVEVLDISHPTLVKLSIKHCVGYELVINAPSLLYFGYVYSPNIAIRGEVVLKSLIKAGICPKPGYSHDGYTAIMKFVSVVSHARHLYLSRYSIEAFYVSNQALPSFCNLIQLEIGEVSRFVLRLLPDLLSKCCHLEVLVFAHAAFADEESVETELNCFHYVPLCVSRNLKVIEFRVFSMQENKWKLVEYFLKNAQVLEKMKINFIFDMSCKEQFEFNEKLLTLSKFSKDCQIVIELNVPKKNEGSFI